MARPRELRNRAKFDSSRDLVANRPMTLSGYQYERGTPIKRDGKYAVSEKALPRFWASYRIEYAEDFQPIETADPVEEAPAQEDATDDAESTDDAQDSDTQEPDADAGDIPTAEANPATIDVDADEIRDTADAADAVDSAEPVKLAGKKSRGKKK